MAQSRRPLFRESAFKQYMQKREKDVLPQLVSPPVFICSWILLCLLLAAGFLAWWGTVPIFASGQGILVPQGQTATAQSGQPAPTATQPAKAASSVTADNSANEALVLLPATYNGQLRVGMPAAVHLGSTGPTYVGKIDAVDSNVVSPGAVPPQYSQSGLALFLTQPSVLVRVRLAQKAPHSAGSVIQARILVGTSRVISLLGGIGQLL
jgi:hypothetical protein